MWSELERQFAVVISELGKLVAVRRGGAKAGGGGGRGVVAGGISAPAAAGGGAPAVAVPLGVTEVDVVRDDLGGAALAALLVRPVADLEPALHHGHAALGEVAADELGGLAPRDHVDEVGGALTGGLVLEIPVD